MIIELKYLAYVFLKPLTIGFFLLLISLTFLFFNKYTKAKVFFSITFLWLFLIAYQPFANTLLRPLESKYESYLDIDSSIKYVIVLGNSHYTNKKISPHSQLTGTSLMRLTEGIRIFKKLDNAKLILSGYAGFDRTSHATILKNIAISMGIDENKIITFEKAQNTRAEAVYTKQLLGDERIALVTSAFHMPRAMGHFEKEKVKAIPAPTDFLVRNKNYYSRILTSRQIRKTEVAMHEYIGIMWASISEKIKLYLN